MEERPIEESFVLEDGIYLQRATLDDRAQHSWLDVTSGRRCDQPPTTKPMTDDGT